MRSDLSLCCVLLVFHFEQTQGDNIFESLLPGAPCFSPRIKTDSLESNNKNKTLFFLFTRCNPFLPEFIHDYGNKLPNGTCFDPKNQVEIFIHGWLDGSCRTAWMREFRDQLLKRGPYNIILVDWTWGNTPDYFHAANNTKIVAEHLGSLILNIMSQTGINASNFHITGHSFGAHIAGFVGKIIFLKIKTCLRRITGLDTAFAPFSGKPPSERLDSSDATLVDLIHSGGGNCFPLNAGMMEPLGDADFYPNGGKVQLSCYHYIFPSIQKGDLLYALFSLLPYFCNHLQSIQYYKVSINPSNCEFVGLKYPDYESFNSERNVTNICKDAEGLKCSVMGMNWECYWKGEKNTTNKYFLNTTLECPHCDLNFSTQTGFPLETNSSYCSLNQH